MRKAGRKAMLATFLILAGYGVKASSTLNNNKNAHSP